MCVAEKWAYMIQLGLSFTITPSERRQVFTYQNKGKREWELIHWLNKNPQFSTYHQCRTSNKMAQLIFALQLVLYKQAVFSAQDFNHKKLIDFWILSKLLHTSCSRDPIHPILCQEWNTSSLDCVYWSLNLTSNKMAHPIFKLQLVLYWSKLFLMCRTTTPREAIDLKFCWSCFIPLGHETQFM